MSVKIVVILLCFCYFYQIFFLDVYVSFFIINFISYKKLKIKNEK